MANWRSAVSRFFRAVFGSITWDPPPWARDFIDELWVIGDAARRVVHNPGQLTALVTGLVAMLTLGTWFAMRPHPAEPVKAHMSVTAPTPPPKRRAREPVPPPDALHVTFDQSVAALALVGKSVPNGIMMKPSLPGTWTWVTDRDLSFMPEQHWPIGQKFDVHLGRQVLAPGAKLEATGFEFETRAFEVNVTDWSFQQDPVDPDGKYVFATIAFNYPVERESLESRVVAELIDPKTEKATPLKIDITYDELRFEAYVKTDALTTPERDMTAQLNVRNGIKAQGGGAPFKEAITRDANVPGRYGVFHIDSVTATVVRDERFEPDLVIVVSTTSGIDEKKVAKAISVIELPADKPGEDGEPPRKDYAWSPDEVTAEIAKRSPRVTLVPVPAEHEVSSLHTFKMASVGSPARDLTPGRYLLVKIPKGLEAHGGYIAADDFFSVVRVPAYPQEVRIMHNGALLAMSGDKRLNLMTRGVPAVKIQLSRILPNELNHVLAMTTGDVPQMQFDTSWFSEENVSEVFSEIRHLNSLNPRTSQYTTIDFSPHVQQLPGGRRGLFLVKVTAWDTQRDAPADLTSTYHVVGEDNNDEGADDDDEGSGDERYDGDDDRSAVNYDQGDDRRFVLVSDIGMVVKTDPRGDQKVFVQSIARGEPMDGATVEVVGKNGLAVVSRRTDATGVAEIPSLKGFTNEKTPIAWVVRNDGDMSFLTINRYGRELDFSRFDVGGVRTRGNADALSAYAFSDRGIYRPGDTFHAAFMVKPVDWAKPVQGVPLQLVVVDPRGIEVKKQRLALPASGFIELAYQTFESAPTGDYTVNCYIVNDKKGNSLLGSTSVRVEEFLPDRLRIETRIGDGQLTGWLTPDDVQAHVALYNLFGTAAADHQVDATMTLRPHVPGFRAFSDYTFSDPQVADQTYDESLDTCTTDAQGHCDFALDLARFAKASYEVDVYATGFELDGGRGVSGHAHAVVSPRPYFVGVKSEGDLTFIKKDAEVGVRLIAVDKNVKAIDVADLKAVRIEEKYVSVLQRQKNGAFAYQSVRKEITRGEEKLAIKAAGSRLKLVTDAPGNFIVSIRDAHDLQLAYVRYSIQGEANLTRDVERSAELELVLDKKDYNSGDSINVAIKAPYAGSGLITIERDQVYTYKWFKTTTTSSVQNITLPAGIEGNGYVNVVFLRASDSPEIFMSPLSYGVAGFSVSQKARQVQVKLESPELVKPGETLKVKYAADRPTKIVVWGVDEGILQVAHYQTPNPLAFFFEKRALEVRTRQILDLVLPEYHIVAALMKQGGDGEDAAGKNLNPFKRKREPPVAFWSGIIDAGVDAKTYTYQVPDTFNGTIRVMAAALAPDAVGVATTKTTARGPFVISPNAPLFVAPGDAVEASVAIANNVEGSGKDAKVDVTLTVGEGLKIDGPATQTLSIPEGREAATRFKLIGTDTLGSAPMKFVAKSGAASVTLSTETSVRPASAFETTLSSGIVASGTADVALARRVVAEHAKLEVTVSSTPLALARSLTSYVESYPHLCTEQVVSATVPSLVLRDQPELAPDAKHAKDQLERALNVLQSRQNEDGSFGYWSANSQVIDYVSVYATHFVLEAAELGHPVPTELKTRALANTRELARKPLQSLSDARLRAYAIYVLARAGEHSARELAELRDYVRQDKNDAWKHDVTIAFLAAAYRLARDESEASSLIKSAELAAKVDDDDRTFNSELTYTAQLLYVLSKHFPERLADFDKKLLARLVDGIGKGYTTTIGSSWALYAFTAYAKTDEVRAAAAKAHVDEERDSGAKGPVSLAGSMYPTGTMDRDAKVLHIANTSDVPLFYSVTVAGFDAKPSDKADTRGLEIVRAYEDDKGKAVTTVELGDVVNVHMKVRATDKTVWNVAVVELLPSGFDLVLDGNGGRVLASGSSWSPEYIDAREDRVVFYGYVDAKANEAVYRLRATTRGTFVVPPTHAVAMYQPGTRGSSARGSIEVVGK